MMRWCLKTPVKNAETFSKERADPAFVALCVILPMCVKNHGRFLSHYVELSPVGNLSFLPVAAKGSEIPVGISVASLVNG